MSVLREGELEFDFSAASEAELFDAQTKGDPFPHGWQPVDFLITETDRRLLLEVKDPFHTKALPKEKRKYLAGLTAKEMVANLGPKARDSYCYLHLMARDDRPFDYCVLLGGEAGDLESALLSDLNTRLAARLKKEAATPWARRYIRNCLVVDLAGWAKLFPNYPVRRLP